MLIAPLCATDPRDRFMIGVEFKKLHYSSRRASLPIGKTLFNFPNFYNSSATYCKGLNDYDSVSGGAVLSVEFIQDKNRRVPT